MRTAFFLLMTLLAPNLQAISYPDVEYGTAGATSLRLDARIPEGKGPFPAAIIVHGGAWVAGDREWSVQPLFEPLTAAGFATFSISYRLAKPGPGGFTLPTSLASFLTLGTAIDDVRHAVAFVRHHAAEYNIDPDRLALIGESAGAQLASMAALRPGPDGSVRAVVAFYGPSDLVRLAQTSPWIPSSVRQQFKDSPLEAMLFAGLREVSPVSWLGKDAPAFLLIHGTADTVVPFDQSEELQTKLLDAGVHCELYPVKGAPHGLRRWEPGLTAYKPRMTAWLKNQLQPVIR